MTATVGVMNGEVQAGDRVAYATRTGSGLWMSIATVLEVTGQDTDWPGPTPALRVEVTQSTGYNDVPRKVMLSVLNRVVKL